MIKKFDQYINEELYPSSVGAIGYGGGVSGYPLNNVLTITGDVDPTLHDVLKNQAPTFTKDIKKKKNKDTRLHNEIGKTIDILSKPMMKVVNERKDLPEHIIYVIQVNDIYETRRVMQELEKIPNNKYWCNDRIKTLEHFPNWLNVNLTYSKKEIHINYWSDENDYEYNLREIKRWIGSDDIYTLKDLHIVLRKIKLFLDVDDPPNYNPKKIVRDLNEGSETTPYVGSGTNVGFGDAEGNYTKAAGQSVSGGDSASAFSSNSSGSKAEQEITCPPKHIFKENFKKKQKKDKKLRSYNKIGSDIDRLHKVSKKVNNENMKTWEEYNESKSEYMGICASNDKLMKKAERLLGKKRSGESIKSMINKLKKKQDEVDDKHKTKYDDAITDLEKFIDNCKDVSKMSKEWNKKNESTTYNRLNEDEGGGGVSSATLGNTGGMGAIVSAQPSSIPGDVAGGTKGSGDIGQPLGIFSKQPIQQSLKRKKNRKDKRDKPYHKIGAGIDNFYVTKYTETKNNGGKIIASWDTFGDV